MFRSGRQQRTVFCLRAAGRATLTLADSWKSSTFTGGTQQCAQVDRDWDQVADVAGSGATGSIRDVQGPIKLWRQATYRAFSGRVKRRDIYDNLDRLRTLRNGIAHHEHLLNRQLDQDLDRVDSVL